MKCKIKKHYVVDKESALSLSAVVNSAVELLAEYNLRLSEELEKRRKVAAMLRDFAQSQRDLAKQAETRLEVSKHVLSESAFHISWKYIITRWTW